MDIVKEMNYERRNNITKIAMIYLSIFMFFILSMNVKAASNPSSPNYIYAEKTTQSGIVYKEYNGYYVTESVQYIGIKQTTNNLDSVRVFAIVNDKSLSKIHLKHYLYTEWNDGNNNSLNDNVDYYLNLSTTSSGIKYYDFSSIPVNGTDGLYTYLLKSSSMTVIQNVTNGTDFSQIIDAYYNGNTNNETEYYSLPNTNFSDNALKLINVNAIIGKAALSYQTTVTWSGTSKNTDELQKLQVVFGVKNETGSNAYENISPLLMDYDVTNNMYSTYLTQLETLYATSHSMSADDIYIEYLRLCPYYEQGENKIWGQYTYINFNESYNSYTVTNELNSFEKINNSFDEYQNMDFANSVYDSSLDLKELRLVSDVNAVLGTSGSHKMSWKTTYTGDAYLVIKADARYYEYLSININDWSSWGNNVKGSCTVYDYLDYVNIKSLSLNITTDRIMQCFMRDNNINKYGYQVSPYYFYVQAFANSLDGVKRSKVYTIEVTGGGVSESIADVITISDENGLITDTSSVVRDYTDTEYGEGITVIGVETKDGSIITQTGTKAIDATPLGSVDDYMLAFVDTMEGLMLTVGQFPAMIGSVFVFLPPAVISIISLGFLVAIILRIIDR